MLLSTKNTALTFAILGLILMGGPRSAADDPAETESTLSISEPSISEPSISEPGDMRASSSKPSVPHDASKEKEYDLSKVFKNDFSEVLGPDTEPQIMIAIQRFQSIPGGATQSYTQHQTVDWTSGNLSPEQCLGVVVHECEKSIRELRQKLESKNSADDAETNEDHLKELKRMYALRFDLDTAYQDFKVSQVEERAKKLRAEVQAREQASEKWVEAMITLAKMKADGIAVAQGYGAPTSAVPFAGVSPTPNWAGPGVTTSQNRTLDVPAFSSPGRDSFSIPSENYPVNRTQGDPRILNSRNNGQGYRQSGTLPNSFSNDRSLGRASSPLAPIPPQASFQPPQPAQPKRLRSSLSQPKQVTEQLGRTNFSTSDRAAEDVSE